MKKKHFADFYDEISNKAEAKKRSLKVQKYINKYQKNAKTILELGIGNGNVLSFFPRKYKLSGLDIEKRYIKLTKQKVPNTHLWISSMHNFKTNKKFDVIFCVFDSINFLKNFKQWELTFKNVHNHLNESGLFIFDMYTKGMLQENKNKSATNWEEKFGSVSCKPIVKDDKLTWHFRIVEKGNKYDFFFKERIFPINKVKKALLKNFKILEKIDGETLKKLNKYTSRVLFVCRRR